jgi:hypothetical protein
VRIGFGLNATDVANARWRALLGRESPVGAMAAILTATALFVPLLAVAAEASLLAWAIFYLFVAAGTGSAIRRAGRAVTSRYGVAASVTTTVLGVASLGLYGCGGLGENMRTTTASTGCLASPSAHMTLIMVAFVLAVIVAYFSGHRQVSVSELLVRVR